MSAARAKSCAGGFSLIELLVATAVVAVALAGAWSWLWSAAGAVRAAGDRAQSATAGAFALRVIGDDVEQAIGLLPTPVGRSPHTALAVLHRHPGEPAETVTLAWDAARGVLWRKTSSTYLADHVCDFTVQYYTADGDELDGHDLLAPGWTERVSRVTVTVCTGHPPRVVVAELQAAVGPA